MVEFFAWVCGSGAEGLGPFRITPGNADAGHGWFSGSSALTMFAVASMA